MLSPEDNDLMCRVGPGTPMGTAMRRYWTPAMQSSDLPRPGGDPRRVVLLGQSFVAFRGEDGIVGILDEFCRHRGVSLALGRVEGCGIRCIFHGWKFGADGEVLETPNVPDPDFRKRVRARSYPVREVGGLVWVYLGPKELEPPFPHYPWFDLEPRHRINAYLVEEANYVQVMEALWDSSHLNFLHADGVAKGAGVEMDFAQYNQRLTLDQAPRTEAEDTDFGFHYVALRPDGDKLEARVAPFIPPYSQLNSNGDLWMSVVPIDDTHSIYFHVWWHAEKAIGEDPLRAQQLEYIGLDDAALRAFGLTYDTINDPYKASIKNGFKQNRAGMASGKTFSGFHSFTQEDSAVLMSSGALRDRSSEMLCQADAGIARLYRCLIEIAKAGRDGRDPIGLDADPMQIKGVMAAVPPEGWQALVPHKKRKAPAGPTIAAA